MYFCSIRYFYTVDSDIKIQQHKKIVLLAFHCNNGLTNAQQYYVIRILPDLFQYIFSGLPRKRRQFYLSLFMHRAALYADIKQFSIQYLSKIIFCNLSFLLRLKIIWKQSLLTRRISFPVTLLQIIQHQVPHNFGSSYEIVKLPKKRVLWACCDKTRM